MSPQNLWSALAYAVKGYFTSINVGKEMLTNNTIRILANGAVSGSLRGQVKETDEEQGVRVYVAFRDKFTSFAINWAKIVVRDGEGAKSLLLSLSR
jgi:glutamate N-acetyltransferase/amino-acid N-acetyltransferase